ncbi:MAG: TetR-like C-terminal domain-containing protein [Faecalibacterium sp.]
MSQTTKRALETSLKKLLLQKPLNKITINDITADCGVNRMTFYYHFKDIYDLVEWILEEDAAKIMEGWRADNSWEDAFETVLRRVQENRTFFLNIYRALSREQLELYLYRLLDPMLNEVVEHECKGIIVRDEDRQFVIDFYKYALVGMALEWIRTDMKEDPARIIARLDIMIRGDLQRSLERFSTGYMPSKKAN